jgi:outer membrane lipopolysaccharide assembly protein LptE/RlpB
MLWTHQERYLLLVYRETTSDAVGDLFEAAWLAAEVKDLAPHSIVVVLARVIKQLVEKETNPETCASNPTKCRT